MSVGRGGARFAVFERRPVAKGKPPELALIATMRKMLVTVDAIANQARGHFARQPAA